MFNIFRRNRKEKGEPSLKYFDFCTNTPIDMADYRMLVQFYKDVGEERFRYAYHKHKKEELCLLIVAKVRYHYRIEEFKFFTDREEAFKHAQARCSKTYSNELVEGFYGSVEEYMKELEPRYDD